MWWVDEPEAARRPYLVLTRQPAVSVLHTVIAVPATRTVRHIPTEVALDVNDGMPTECALSLDNITVMPKEFFRERITRLSVDRMNQVCRALSVAAGCD